jgi:hypothetical protein
MAFGDASNPARFGYGQSDTDARNLFLDVFGGEVMAAFDLAVLTLDKHNVKTVGGGARSWRFPKVWKATAEYHSPGQEMLGNDIDTTEISVTVDDILVSHTDLADLDKMLTHFDVRSEYARTMGFSLAKVFDKNVFRQILLAARASADGPFPGGTVVTDSALSGSAVTAAAGNAWIEHIREANRALFALDIPEEQPRYLAVSRETFDAIRFARLESSSGNYYGDQILQHQDYGAIGAGLGNRRDSIMIDGVTIYATRNKPTTDESADASVYEKYRADYSTTTGIMWCPMAVATVKVMDMGFENARDTRRLSDFTVAKMLVGHGTLRPECAVEFKTS